MGRPVLVSDAAIIHAGKAMTAEGRTVNANRLCKAVGKRGRPERLARVWFAYIAAANNDAGPLPERPPPSETMVRIVGELKAQIVGAVERGMASVYDELHASWTDEVRTQLADAVASGDALTIELNNARQALEDLTNEHAEAKMSVVRLKLDASRAHKVGDEHWDTVLELSKTSESMKRRIASLENGAIAQRRATETSQNISARAQITAEALETAFKKERPAVQDALKAILELRLQLRSLRHANQAQRVELKQHAAELKAVRSEARVARAARLKQITQIATQEAILQDLVSWTATDDRSTPLNVVRHPMSARRPARRSGRMGSSAAETEFSPPVGPIGASTMQEVAS